MFAKITQALARITDEGLRRVGVVRSTYVIEQYVRAGARFGEVLHHMEMGDGMINFVADGSRFDKPHMRWALFERQYAALGFRTISGEDFVEYGARGVLIKDLLRVMRDADEPAILHSEVFKGKYASGFRATTDVDQLMEEVASTGSNLPSLVNDESAQPASEDIGSPISPVS